MSNSVLVATTMTGRSERYDDDSEIEVNIDPASGLLAFGTIRRVVWTAPPAELQALERLWLFARGVVSSPDDFLPRHIDIEQGRSDVARAWLKLNAARREPGNTIARARGSVVEVVL